MPPTSSASTEASLFSVLSFSVLTSGSRANRKLPLLGEEGLEGAGGGAAETCARTARSTAATIVSAKRCSYRGVILAKGVGLGGKHFEQADHSFAQSVWERPAWSECRGRDNFRDPRVRRFRRHRSATFFPCARIRRKNLNPPARLRPRAERWGRRWRGRSWCRDLFRQGQLPRQKPEAETATGKRPGQEALPGRIRETPLLFGQRRRR